MPSDSAAARADIHRSLIHGIAWTGALRWVGQTVSWISTMVVARLLTPADYGIFGMANAALALLSLIAEFGIGSAVVYLRDLSDEQVEQINGLSVLFGVAGCVSCLALAYPLGLFFDNTAVGPALAGLSVTLVLGSLRSVPWALLQKDLRFKRLAVFESLQTVTLAGLNVILAALGFGYWTLVVGSIAASVISTAIALRFHAHRFAWPRMRTIRSILPFLRDIVLQRIAWWVNSSADMIVAGRTMGSHLAGVYGLAWTLSDAPAQKVNEVVMRVAPGVMAMSRDDDAALRGYVLMLTQGLSLILFPAAFGLALVADVFVFSVLGAKWAPMVVPLQILSLYMAVRSVAAIPAHILNLKEHATFVARVNVAGMVVMPLAFYTGSHFGPVGLALAWVFAHPLILFPLFSRTFRVISMRWREYISAIAPALVSSLAMAAVVMLMGLAPLVDSPILSLLLRCVAGAAVYIAVLWVLYRSVVERVVRAVKFFRSSPA